MSEIASNRWEAESSKPPIVTVGGIAQILVMAVFAMLFAYILFGCMQGIFGSQKKSMADKYGEMTADGEKKPEAAAPAAE